MKEEDFFYIDNILHYKISDKESLSFDFLKGRLFNRLKRIEHESLIKKAIGKNLDSPEHLKLNMDKKETFDIIGNSNSEVKNYILGKIQ